MWVFCCGLKFCALIYPSILYHFRPCCIDSSSGTGASVARMMFHIFHIHVYKIWKNSSKFSRKYAALNMKDHDYGHWCLGANLAPGHLWPEWCFIFSVYMCIKFGRNRVNFQGNMLHWIWKTMIMATDVSALTWRRGICDQNDVSYFPHTYIYKIWKNSSKFPRKYAAMKSEYERPWLWPLMSWRWPGAGASVARMMFHIFHINLYKIWKNSSKFPRIKAALKMKNHDYGHRCLGTDLAPGHLWPEWCFEFPVLYVYRALMTSLNMLIPWSSQ